MIYIVSRKYTNSFFRNNTQKSKLCVLGRLVNRQKSLPCKSYQNQISRTQKPGVEHRETNSSVSLETAKSATHNSVCFYSRTMFLLLLPYSLMKRLKSSIYSLRKIFRQKELRAERILTSCPHYSPICREIKTASTWKSWSHPEHPNLHPWDSAEESFVSVEQKIRDSLSPLASYGIANCFLTGNQQGKQGIDIEKNGLKGKELHTLESAWTL